MKRVENVQKYITASLTVQFVLNYSTFRNNNTATSVRKTEYCNDAKSIVTLKTALHKEEIT